MGVDNDCVRVTMNALTQIQAAPERGSAWKILHKHGDRGGTLFSPDNDLRNTDDRHTVTSIVMRTDIDVLDLLITNDEPALMALGYPFGLAWSDVPGLERDPDFVPSIIGSSDMHMLLDTMDQARATNYQERVAQLAKENDHIDQDDLNACFTDLLTLVRAAAHDGDILIWYMA